MNVGLQQKHFKSVCPPLICHKSCHLNPVYSLLRPLAHFPCLSWYHLSLHISTYFSLLMFPYYSLKGCSFHLQVYEAFMEGNHTTRYSNELFSGQFSDQTIEETLMRKAKSNGGLTRGRMRNERSVKVWAGTFSHLKLLGDLMEEMFGGKRSKWTHADLGAKRLEKDSQHVKLISAWFLTHNPFIEVSIDLFHLLQ